MTDLVVPMRLPSLVIFDWDHTLVSTPMPICKNNIGKNIGYYSNFLCGENIKAMTDNILSTGLPITRHSKGEGEYCLEWCKVHNAQAVLDYLLSRKICMAVVSNKDRSILDIEVKSLGWSSYFGAVIGRGDAQAIKPAPDPVYLAMERCCVDSGDKVWFIGDTLVDVLAANLAKCLSVHYKYRAGNEYDDIYKDYVGQYEADSLSGFGATGPVEPSCTISDMLELIELIKACDAEELGASGAI